jgi:hypothetical protein
MIPDHIGDPLGPLSEEDKQEKEILKKARSEAELIALSQRKIQITLTATNVLVSCLIALKTFGLI